MYQTDMLTSVGYMKSHAHVNNGRLNKDKTRSEEHTSELQSHSDLVCRLLLEKKKKNKIKKKKKIQKTNTTKITI